MGDRHLHIKNIRIWSGHYFFGCHFNVNMNTAGLTEKDIYEKETYIIGFAYNLYIYNKSMVSLETGKR